MYSNAVDGIECNTMCVMFSTETLEIVADLFSVCGQCGSRSEPVGRPVAESLCCWFPCWRPPGTRSDTAHCVSPPTASCPVCRAGRERQTGSTGPWTSTTMNHKHWHSESSKIWIFLLSLKLYLLKCCF